MLYVVKRLRKWSNISISEGKPLAWLFLGPLFLLLTTLCARPMWAHPLFPCIVIGSLCAIWRSRKEAWGLACALFILYFGAALIWGKCGWQVMVQEMAFAMGLAITYLSLEEVSAFYAHERREHTEAISSVKMTLHSLEEKRAMQERHFEKERQNLSKELARAHEEVEAYSRLALASQIEAKKNFDQNQLLSAKSLKFHREIVSLKQKIEGQSKALDELKEREVNLELALKKRICTLNHYRVESFQACLIIDGYIERFRSIRTFFLKKSKEAKELPSPQKKKEVPSEEKQQHALKALEEKKWEAKKVYDEHATKWKELKEKVTRLQRKLDRASHTEEIEEIELEKQKLSDLLLKKRGDLEQVKANYMEIERDIFLMRKELQSQGAFAL